jgi:methylmalonyl-CoA mutase
LGGSYAIENLTNQLCENAWKLFRQIERFGGIEIHEAQSFLKKSITEKKSLKKLQIENGQGIYIGINKYQSKDSIPNITYRKLPDYMDLPFFNIEQ